MSVASITSAFSYSAMSQLLTGGSANPSETGGAPQIGQTNSADSSAPVSRNPTDSVELSVTAKAVLSRLQNDQTVANQLQAQVQMNRSSGSITINPFARPSADGGIPATYNYSTLSANTSPASQSVTSVSAEISLDVTATTSLADDSSGSTSTSSISSQVTLSITAETSTSPATSSSLLAKTSTSAQGKLYTTPSGSYWMADQGGTVDTTVELLGLMTTSDDRQSTPTKQSNT